MNYRIAYSLFVILPMLSSSLLGQNSFVYFETTNRTNQVCSNKPIGIIATLSSNYQELTTYGWIDDQSVISEVRNGIAMVNTSSPGEKQLKFRLTINENHRLDTTITITVLPLPSVAISYDGKILKSSIKNEIDAFQYNWIFNNEVLNINEPIINKPNKGVYRAVISDTNGCLGSSEVFTVK
jgi:hypothetical protein